MGYGWPGTIRKRRPAWKRRGLSHHLATPKVGFTELELRRFLRTDHRTLKRIVKLAKVRRRPYRYRPGFWPFTADECKRIIRTFHLAVATGIIKAQQRYARVGKP